MKAGEFTWWEWLVGRFRFWYPVLGLMVGVAAAAAEPWRFVMTCDSRGGSATGINEPILAEIVAEIVRWNADFVIFPGDLVYGGRISPARFEDQLWAWVRAMGPLYDAGIGVYPCRGNHEVGDAWDSDWGYLPNPVDNYSHRWLRVFGSETRPDLRLPGNGPDNAKYMSYSIAHKNALILAVDEYGGTRHRLAHAVDQSWVDSQLRANRKPHVFVFGHEPAFQVLHPDCLDDHPAERDAFWRRLQTGGARAYFCGHDHFYNHARVGDGDDDPNDDIHQFVAATAGAPRYTWSPPYDGDNSRFNVIGVHYAERWGYLVVEVNDLDVTMTWMQRRSRDDSRLPDDASVPGVYEPADVWRYRAAAGLALWQPNGGERVVAGRPYEVQWRVTEGTATRRVAVEYSLDRGRTWAVADEVDNTGLYMWTAPLASSDTCLLRITDAGDGAIYDTSDSVFSIAVCPVQHAADLNGDCRVDFSDLALLATEWLASVESPSLP